MKDLNRKPIKFDSKKNSPVKKSQSGASSPVKGFSASPVKSSFGSPAKKGFSTTITHNINSRRVSMTVSFFNTTKPENFKLKDFAVVHETHVAKYLPAPNTDRARSPRRDPILQNNEEEVREFKPSKRTIPTKTTMFTEEERHSRKHPGEFNDRHEARSQSPRIEGIRTNIAPPRDFSADVKRQLKTIVPNHLKNVFNPIVEGDPKSIKPIKERHHAEPSEEYQRMMDKKCLLPTERVASPRVGSPKGRVCWETSIPLGEQPIQAHVEKSPVKKQRKFKIGSNQESAKDLLEYTYSPKFRDQGVSGKCTDVAASTLVKACETLMNEEQ